MPSKNILKLAGVSLLDRAIQCAIDVGGEVVITTDYAPHQFVCPSRAIRLERPATLATAAASMWDVLAHVGQQVRWTDEDTIVLLQPTSLHQDRVGIVRTMLHDAVRAGVTVDRYPDRWHPWYALCPSCPNHPPDSRHRLPERFRPNGLAYVMSGLTARRRSFWQDLPKFYEVTGVTNIDTPEDWAEAERIYGRL